MRKNPKPLRDGTNGNANPFYRGAQSRRDNYNQIHRDNQVDFYPRRKKEWMGKCSFYISNFSKNWKEKDLMEIFSKYDKVKDVIYGPRKKEPNGLEIHLCKVL